VGITIARAVHGVAARARSDLDTLDLTHDPAWSTFSFRVSARNKDKTMLAVRRVYGIRSTRRAPRRCESQPQHRGVGASATPPTTPRTSPNEPAYALELRSLRDSTYPALLALCLGLKPVAERGRQNGRGIAKRAPQRRKSPPLPHHGAPGDPACDPIEPAYALEPRSLAWLHVPRPSPALWPAEDNPGREK